MTLQLCAEEGKPEKLVFLGSQRIHMPGGNRFGSADGSRGGVVKGIKGIKPKRYLVTIEWLPGPTYVRPYKMRGRLKESRECIRTNRYIVITHAAEELDDDGLTIYGLERIILAGQIVEEQKDRDRPETKFLVRGPTLDDDVATVVVKPGPTNKLIVISVFRDSYD